MKNSYENISNSEQNMSNSLKLYHDKIQLCSDHPVSCAGLDMHSPATTLTYLHWHDALEVGYCYEGSGVFIVNHRMETFSAGQASMIFQNELHIARSSTADGSRWRFVYLDPVGLLGRRYPEYEKYLHLERKGLPFLFNSDAPDGISHLIRDLIDASQRQDAVSQMEVHGIVMQLLVRLSNLSRREGEQLEDRQPIHSLSPAIEKILFHYEQPLSLPDLADVCGMSLSTYQRAFHRAMGVSPGRYIQQLRIRMSCLLLANSDMPVLEVSEQVGYESLSSYNRHFRNFMNMTPRDYRKRQSESQ